ncbi:methyl-CpG-binding domain protein 3-like isoform X2 [Watersipora subatra]|uniref:methyl-CpG-binding domain protein 3-like isoform X2 n=1 Tax=Watersipora subatra TaxID=2589382 RepID=UPI00355BDF7C
MAFKAYLCPNGKKYRSKPQIARELGNDCDLTAFDFKAGQAMSQSSMVRRAKGKKTPYDFAKGSRNESNLTLPVRQTASIFKQPVTVIRSHPDSQVKHDLKHGNPEATQPRQLFWEKALSDVKMGQLGEEDLTSIVLPSKIKGIGPDMTNENLLHSIAAALHLNHSPVVGQSQSVTKFAKSPTVHINTSQPLIQQVVITDEDIRQQQSKVVSSRRKVEELLAAIEKNNRETLLKEDMILSAQSKERPESSTGSSSIHDADSMAGKSRDSPACDSLHDDADITRVSDDADQGSGTAEADKTSSCESISSNPDLQQNTSLAPPMQESQPCLNKAENMSVDRPGEDNPSKMETDTADDVVCDATNSTTSDTPETIGV